MKNNKIVLITTGQPSTNPRLVKEADALTEAGFLVTVLYQYYNNWATEKDIKLLETKKWLAICVGGSPKVKKLTFWYYRVAQKFYTNFTHKLALKHSFAEKAICRSDSLLLKQAIKLKADLYIAHNLGALPIAVFAAKKNNTKCGFDAEDFHRNEVSNDPNNYDVRLKAFIEDKYIEQLDYLTVASPLIAKAYQKIYPQLNPVVINNVFEIKYQPKHCLDNTLGLKLFWFSQTIGKNRGLEDVFKALNTINNPIIELHLLGSLSAEDEIYFNNLAKFTIQYHKPISPEHIFSFANKFDIGLALEPGFCLNNEIALSNKIFSYLISGLAIIASNTVAQQEFMTENTEIGKLYTIGNTQQLAQIINKLLNNKELLQHFKSNAYHLAQATYNWEIENKKFIKIVKQTLTV